MRLALRMLAVAAGGLMLMAGRSRSRDHRPPYGLVERPVKPERGGDPFIRQKPEGASLRATDGHETSGDSHHRSEERQFWRKSLIASWATVGAAIIAAVIAGGAFKVALDQADTARDQKVRSLRAYVSIEAAPAPELIDGLPGMELTVENVGQTPAYRLHVSAPVAITGRGDPRVEAYKGEDCKFITDAARGGLSLARVPIKQRYGVAPMRAEQARGAVASGAYEVRADILACYHDVFGTVQHVRMCRRYFPGWRDTIPCDGEQDEHS